jgi:poly-beta-1,6-N-acetyl-D-glucosamine synthase
MILVNLMVLLTLNLISIAVSNLLLFWGLKKLFKTQVIKKNKDNEESLSVVVAARNEERNIPQLIKGLFNQDSKSFNFFVVDDYSTDKTKDVVENIFENKSNSRLLFNKSAPGKKNALTTAILESADELIMVTDADCIPENKWVRSFQKKFSEGYDLLFGIAPFYTNKKIVSVLSAFENLRGFMLSIAAVSYNLPYSAASRSLGFRRSSFLNIGGYSGTMEIPFGDDGLLIREAVKHKLKVGVVTNDSSFVYTQPEDTFGEYFRQRKRHTRTSFFYSSKVKTMLAAWHIINLLPILLLFLSPLNPILMIPFLLKVFSDVLIVLSFQKKFGYTFRLHQIIFYQIFYEIILIINFFNALTGKIKWKNEPNTE